MITTTCLILLMPPAAPEPDVVPVDLLADELPEHAVAVMAAAHPSAATENLRRALMPGRYAANGHR
jgi:hypothetical protein